MFYSNSIFSSIKLAKLAKEEALAKQSKMQITKYQYAKQKPAVVVKPPTVVLKNASVEETVSAVAAVEEEEEKLEDKIRANIITAKEKRVYTALLEYLQQHVISLLRKCPNSFLIHILTFTFDIFL